MLTLGEAGRRYSIKFKLKKKKKNLNSVLKFAQSKAKPSFKGVKINPKTLFESSIRSVHRFSLWQPLRESDGYHASVLVKILKFL